MTLYINEDTNEYPRFQGDVDLNPDANWAIVDETQMPPETDDGKIWVEDVPVLDKKGWRRTWKQIEAPVRTKESEMARAEAMGIDLKLLGLVK
jgi:hypothetical protein